MVFNYYRLSNICFFREGTTKPRPQIVKWFIYIFFFINSIGFLYKFFFLIFMLLFKFCISFLVSHFQKVVFFVTFNFEGYLIVKNFTLSSILFALFLQLQKCIKVREVKTYGKPYKNFLICHKPNLSWN